MTQRGTRKDNVFFCAIDYQKYIDLLGEWKIRTGVRIWAYCLMPNYVHLIVVPDNIASLSKFVGETHRRYARYINRRQDWSGHLWQERFYSTAMNEAHCFTGVRYIAQNPVRAGLVEHPEQWRWSSARAHLKSAADPLLDPSPLGHMITDWQSFIAQPPSKSQLKQIRLSTRSGHPIAKLVPGTGVATTTR